MKETSFIEQNKRKWHKFQSMSSTNAAEPEKIAELYSDITNDLSYAQTFYSSRTVRVYLNQVAQGIHNLVHKQRGDSLKKFLTVWSTSLPLEIYRSRKNIYFALGMFMLWATLGAVTTIFFPDFPEMVLGSEYVRVTYENVAKGDPLAIYHDKEPLVMFIQIAQNNISISFYMFILGIFFSIGSHIMLFSNAVMVGAFQFMFFAKGLLLTSFLGIWIHGAFEISSIVIAAAAGFTLGNGLLFPGSYSRLQSLQFSAKRGIKIMLSLVPILTIAALLESYVTHNYQLLPEWSKWAIILFSFALIAFYYIIYPLYVARKYPEKVHEDPPTVRPFKNTFVFNKVREFDAYFSDTFSFYRVHVMKIVKYNMIYSVPIIIAVAIFQDTNAAHYQDLIKQHTYDWSAQLSIIMGFDVLSPYDFIAAFAWTIVFSNIIITTLYHIKNQENKMNWSAMTRFLIQKLPGVWMGMILLYLTLLYLPWYLMFFMLFFAPFIWLQGASIVLGPYTFGKNFGKGFSYGTKGYGQTILSIMVMSLVLFLFAQPIAFVYSFHTWDWMSGTTSEPYIADFLDRFCGLIKEISREYTPNFILPTNIVRQFIYIIFLLFILPLFTTAMGFSYMNIHEKLSSNGLRQKFQEFGKRKKFQESEYDFE